MSGSHPQYPIVLTTEEAAKLENPIKTRNIAQRKVLRAKIVLTTHQHPTWNNQQIAQEVA